MDRIRQACALAVLALLLAACGGQQPATTFQQPGGEDAYGEAEQDGYGQAEQESAQVAQAPAGGAATVSVAESAEFGRYLTDGAGRAIYLFTNDTDGQNTCTPNPECNANWPVFETTDTPAAPEGVDAAQLTALPLPDGRSQVKCGVWPTYYFAGDQGPGTTNGQGVGDVWYLIGTDCKAIKGAAAAAPAAPAPAVATTVVKVADCGALGQCLVDGDGRTLYRFTNEKKGQIACTGDCEKNWPPFISDVEPTGEGVDQSLLGLITRAGKLTQVTCSDWPLYYFAGDSAAGQFNGQGVGGNWFVVAPDCSTITG